MIPNRTYLAHRVAASFLVLSFILLVNLAVPEAIGCDRYDEYLVNSETDKGFSGSVLVLKDDSVLIAKGFGLADQKRGIQNGPDTKFLLCSLTKPFTATAIMQLAEKGSVSLGDPITRYLPNYSGSASDSITVYNLLTQTSGIPDYLSLIDSNETFSNPVSVDNIISRLMKAPLEFEPGSKWEYSNSNYYLLGKIIELVSDLSYGEYMDKNVFAPMHMDNSGFPDRYLNDLPKSATGYRSDETGGLAGAPLVHSSWPFSAGGLYSTVTDLAKWDRGLRNGSLITSESIARMFTPFRWRYGCGWEVDTLHDMRVASHGGTGGGYCAIMIRFIDEPICIVVLSNKEDAFREVSKIGYDLASLTLGVPLKAGSSAQLETVDPGILEEYAGDYELAPGIALTFIHREGGLFTHGPGQPEMEIYPRSETEFFLKAVEGSVKFVRDSTGTVSSIIVRQGGRDISAKKIR